MWVGLMMLFFLVMMLIFGSITFRKNKEFYDGCAVFFAIFWFISLIGFFVTMGVCTGCVIDYKTQLVKLDKDKVVLEERFDAQIKLIENYIEKYPLEENIYQDLSKNLTVLLTVPQIKSDTLIMGCLTKALEIQDDLYKVDFEKNEVERKLDFHSYRLWSGTLVDPKY